MTSAGAGAILTVLVSVIGLLIGLAISYWIIRAAVRNGTTEALKAHTVWLEERSAGEVGGAS